MLGDEEIQFQAGQAQAADQAGDQEGGDHGGQDQEQQIVGRRHRGHTHQYSRGGEQQAAARDFVAYTPQ